jgi:hypothetical protein
MTQYRPRNEPRSERAQECKGTPTYVVLGRKLALLTRSVLHHYDLQASSRHKPIASDRRGLLLGRLGLNYLRHKSFAEFILL